LFLLTGQLLAISVFGAQYATDRTDWTAGPAQWAAAFLWFPAQAIAAGLFFRYGLQAALSNAEDISLVAEAADGAEAVTTAIDLAADVVLMDHYMPGTSGIPHGGHSRMFFRSRPVAGAGTTAALS
jgi:hypothetical protein